MKVAIKEVKVFRDTNIDDVQVFKQWHRYPVIGQKLNWILIEDEQGGKQYATNPYLEESNYDFCVATKVEISDVTGGVKFTQEGIDEFVSWFQNGSLLEAALKHHEVGGTFKITEINPHENGNVKVAFENEEWWVSLVDIDKSSIEFEVF